MRALHIQYTARQEIRFLSLEASSGSFLVQVHLVFSSAFRLLHDSFAQSKRKVPAGTSGGSVLSRFTHTKHCRIWNVRRTYVETIKRASGTNYALHTYVRKLEHPFHKSIHPPTLCVVDKTYSKNNHYFYSYT
jgi:hypothetical protein